MVDRRSEVKRDPNPDARQDFLVQNVRLKLPFID
jgi:hypothetical protein